MSKTKVAIIKWVGGDAEERFYAEHFEFIGEYLVGYAESWRQSPPTVRIKLHENILCKIENCTADDELIMKIQSLTSEQLSNLRNFMTAAGII